LTGLVKDPQYAHLEVLRCRSRLEVEATFARLVARRKAAAGVSAP
jgi:hypothetical protein